MIVVDTSVWIGFLRGKTPYFEYLLYLLEHREVFAFDLIFAELLQGSKTDRERKTVFSYWNSLPKFDSPNIALEAGLNSGTFNWSGKGVGLIDSIIIMYAKKSKSQLWTLDKKLHKIVKKEEIYDPLLI